MFEFLQDRNWPAYEEAEKFLSQIDVKILDPYINKSYKQALKNEDGMWMENIESFTKKRNDPL